MNDRLELREPLIAPIYWQSGPNQPIEFGRVAIEYDHKGTTYQDQAIVTIKFLPRERLEFTCSIDDKPPHFAFEFWTEPWSGELRLTDRDVRVKAHHSAMGKEHGGMIFQPTRSGFDATVPSSSIVSTTFHIFNFPEFIGPENYLLITGAAPRESSKSLGCVELKANGWVVEIAATDKTGEQCKALKAQGGFALTHMGRLKREDATAFSSETLEDQLSCLHYFLSFALGRWSGVALPVGFDENGKKVFEQWGLRITADGKWKGSLSWFDSHHAELLAEVYPGFVKLWNNALWQEPLRHSLYWYLGANDRRTGIGVDAGLILAQTALELLAWTYCVCDRKMVSPAAFKPRGLNAADKLRLLASSLNLPLAIPPEMTAIQSASGRKWVDAMDAITSIRNSLVHPDPQPVPDRAYFEAWKLSLWYIDLVLLRLCSHVGEYANRLSQRYVGMVEPMP